MKDFNCIVVLGPTACGKTKLAVRLAEALNGEIISADSRQVYKHLNIGTGKDLEEYTVDHKRIPYHLIDVAEPEEQFYLHHFTRLCKLAFEQIVARRKLPVICGGTGLYLDTLRKDFSYTQIKENFQLREELGALSKDQLLERLRGFPEELRQHADETSKKRLLRAIEVAEYLLGHPGEIKKEEKPYVPYYIGIHITVEERRELISSRLRQRISQGLVDEVRQLLKTGLTHQRLQFLGLEYKFISLHLQGLLPEKEMILQLERAIFQFAKRQMTWFRKMEREGVKIHWINKEMDVEALILKLQKEFS
jgi:tRNA dimethylallyltransferase